MKNGDYVLVKAPEEYPGKTYYNNYCYKHRLKWWEEKGKLPSEDEVVHHKNGDKTDNRIENLEIMKNSEHTVHHHSSGRTKVKLECPECGESFVRERRQTHLVKGGDKTFCSRECSGRYSRKLRS